MAAADLNNAIGLTPLDAASALRPTFYPLGAADDAEDSVFLRFLDKQRGDVAAARPMMFESDALAKDQSLLERLHSERPAAKDEKGELREAAEQLVSTTFIMPLFDQLRNDPLATNMFHGGQSETIFRRQLDQNLSDRIAAGSGFDIVDAIYNQFAKYADAKKPVSGETSVKGVDFRA